MPDKAYQERHRVHFDQDYHGTDGPLHTGFSVDYSPHTQYWDATLNNLNVGSNRNHHSGSNVGHWTALAGIDPKTQERCYSARAYYLPASHRENLIVLTGATARDIVLEKDIASDDWIAKGVQFTYGGKDYAVHVEGEIILSAGSGQSPQLLELSGIGNPEILKAAGIETKVSNPNVGENLQDHMSKSGV